MDTESDKSNLALFLDFASANVIRFRVISVSGFAFSCYLLNDAWEFYKLHYEQFETYGAAAGIGAFILGFIGLVKYTLDNVVKKHEGHGE